MLGQRVSMTATVPSQGLNGHLTKYEYDSLYQLTKASYPGVAPFNGEVDSWTYDAIGNRLTNTVNGAAQTYTYQKVGANPNNWQKLLSDGVNTYTWGSVFPSAYPASSAVSGPGGTFTFGYNHRGQTASISGSVAASYGYDHQGRRGSKTVAGATSSYLYDGLNLVRETGATPAEYLFGPGIDEPLAMSRGGQVYYYATDALGSVAAITNSGGAVQDTYLYDAWGVTRRQTGFLANPFGYTAREFGEAGQFFYRARYYRPSVGRFLSEDDPKQQDGPTAYAYVSNAPVRYTDPTGLAILRCWRPLRFPLNILPYFTGPLTIPVPGNNWCPLHEYVYNTDIHDSKGFDPRENRPETGRDNCRVIPEPAGTCVWNTFEQASGPRADYNFVTNNCHHAVNRAVKRCTPCAAAPPIPLLTPWFNDRR
jgi:RHS repeat-associated protein